MDPGETVLSDRVRINDVATLVTLTAGGQLRWSGRCLEIEKEVLGFSVEGSRIKIRAVVESEAGICCCENKIALLRKTFTFEPFSDESLRLWSQKLQELIDSLGKNHHFLNYLFIAIFPTILEAYTFNIYGLCKKNLIC